ncbi:VCBS repeat-containing protein [Streptomyces sp. NPDC094049]|uniref:VCBS repeat-containing protein n=1 Tax=Streptomyces sp. NPDC094049 TaxID=3154987 RepID=UPI003318FEC1
MSHGRRNRRLGTAVLVALAVTAGLSGGTATATATAATAEGTTAPARALAPAAADPADAFGPGDSLVSLGRTGFLSWDAEDANVARWTRFADGSVYTFPPNHFVFGSRDSDLVVEQRRDLVTLRDMTTGESVQQVSTTSAGPDGQFAGAVREHVFVSADDSEGTRKVLYVYSPGEAGAAPSRRAVTGLPTDATSLFAVGAAGDDVLLSYRTGPGAARTHWAVVDLGTAGVTAHRETTSATYGSSSPVLSATHVAWARHNERETVVEVLERATGRLQRIVLPGAGNLTLGLVGKWVTYARRDGLLDTSVSAQHAVTARDLYGTATRKLLDHAVEGLDAPGDAIGVRGGTVAGGEGVYRIEPGAGGVPVATRVAATGAPTKVTLLGHNVPATLDLDRSRGRFTLNWRLSRTNVSMTAKLRNTRTGEYVTENALPVTGVYDPHTMTYAWRGELLWEGRADQWTGASPGPYTWEITAKPLNGIGPDLRASGSFTVTRKPGAHDYDSDGSPDVLARDTTGRLWIHDSFTMWPWSQQLNQNPKRLVGSGWGAYDRIEAAGNLGGSTAPDLVARDRSGVLWLYRGTGDGRTPFATRARIGGGWSGYDKLTGGSDVTGDGRPDLLAADRSGVLWLHPGTGDANAPFAARKRIGGGWGAYNDITAVGNLAGGAAGDLVARDRAGVLWLHLGKGDGTLAPRTRIGSGWGAFKHLVGAGDGDLDGRPDLFAAAPGPSASLYRGTGDWRRPFHAPWLVGTLITPPEVVNDLYV